MEERDRDRVVARLGCFRLLGIRSAFAIHALVVLVASGRTTMIAVIVMCLTRHVLALIVFGGPGANRHACVAEILKVKRPGES